VDHTGHVHVHNNVIFSFRFSNRNNHVIDPEELKGPNDPMGPSLEFVYLWNHLYRIIMATH